jgi:antitoxin VapB
MPKKATAKLFQNGRSQAVRLPKEFRFEGKEVRISRVGLGVLLEPEFPNAAALFAEIDKHRTDDFMKGGRKQPRAPKRKIFE